MYEEMEKPLSLKLYSDIANGYSVFKFVETLEEPSSVYTISDLGNLLPEDVRQTMAALKEDGILEVYHAQSTYAENETVEKYMIKSEYKEILSDITKEAAEMMSNKVARDVLYHLNTVNPYIGIFHNTDYVIADDLKIDRETASYIADSLVELELATKETGVYRGSNIAIPYTVYNITSEGKKLLSTDKSLRKQLTLDREESDIKRWFIKHFDFYMEKKAKEYNI